MPINKKYSILIISNEGEESEIITLREFLTPNYSIFLKKSGIEGVEFAKEHLPDIILLDAPSVNGNDYETLCLLKSEKTTKDIPVTLVSSFDDCKYEERAFVMGAVDYVTKPVNSIILKLRIESQLRMIEYFRKIEALSLTDPLTGLPNRRFFEARFNVEWGRAKREKNQISILMLDIDNFKFYNDSFGHQQGDFALKTLGDVVTETLKRSTDFVARWGGEEFVVILPNTPKEGAIEVAEKIRKNIESEKVAQFDKQARTVPSDWGGYRITVSIGVATYSYGDKDVDKEDVILNADKALYQAKSEGRNRICFL